MLDIASTTKMEVSEPFIRQLPLRLKRVLEFVKVTFFSHSKALTNDAPRSEAVFDICSNKPIIN